MDTNGHESGTGMGANTVLFLIFLVLKLTGQIDWSWWWVTVPLWLPFALLFGFLGLCLCVGLVCAALEWVMNK